MGSHAVREAGVLVFTTDVLPASQTFVRDHVVRVSGSSLLLGTRRVHGLSTSGIPTATIPHSRLSRLLLYFFGVSPFIDKLRSDHELQVIHAHFADAGMRIARYAARRSIPLVVTLHGSDILRQRRNNVVKRLTLALLRRAMFRNAELFLPVSRFVEQAAASVGFPPDKLHTHYLGIPLPSEAGEMDQPYSYGNPANVLFVGRLVEKKGVDLLIAACKLVATRGHRFRLTIVGDGPLASDHRAACESLDAPFRFLGALTPVEVLDEMRQADVFCMPSTRAADGDNEGLGLVYLEAQALGVPVVAFDQGPVGEAVINGQTGLLVADKDVEALASAIEKLLIDPILRAQLGKAGKRFVRENFDIDTQAKWLGRLYAELAACKQVPAVVFNKQ